MIRQIKPRLTLRPNGANICGGYYRRPISQKMKLLSRPLNAVGYDRGALLTPPYHGNCQREIVDDSQRKLERTTGRGVYGLKVLWSTWNKLQGRLAQATDGSEEHTYPLESNSDRNIGDRLSVALLRIHQRAFTKNLLTNNTVNAAKLPLKAASEAA